MKYTVEEYYSLAHDLIQIWYQYHTKIKHREGNLPAMFLTDKPDRYQAYWLFGRRHRTDGPAIYINRITSIAPYQKYWLNGNPVDVVSDQEFKKYQKLLGFS